MKIWTQDKTFEVIVSLQHFPWLREHRIENVPIMPGAGYIEVSVPLPFSFFFSPIKYSGGEREERKRRWWKGEGMWRWQYGEEERSQRSS